MVGDLHGLNTLEHQPTKIAAMEGRWEGEGPAPLVLFAVPDQKVSSVSVTAPSLDEGGVTARQLFPELKDEDFPFLHRVRRGRASGRSPALFGGRDDRTRRGTGGTPVPPNALGGSLGGEWGAGPPRVGGSRRRADGRVRAEARGA